MHRIHVPQKIKTIYHTKILKVPVHHHYFHEKEKLVPEHHHYIHEKEKVVKWQPHDNKEEELGFYKGEESYEKDEIEDYPRYPPHKDDYTSASESKKVLHRRPPQRFKHHKRKSHRRD